MISHCRRYHQSLLRIPKKYSQQNLIQHLTQALLIRKLYLYAYLPGSLCILYVYTHSRVTMKNPSILWILVCWEGVQMVFGVGSVCVRGCVRGEVRSRIRMKSTRAPCPGRDRHIASSLSPLFSVSFTPPLKPAMLESRVFQFQHLFRAPFNFVKLYLNFFSSFTDSVAVIYSTLTCTTYIHYLRLIYS